MVTTGAQFGRAIGAAAAKFPEDIKRGTAAFEALNDAAREVGRTTEFTSTQGAGALEFFAKAGYSAEFAIAALRPSVDFATATMLEFDRAADIASDTLGAFNLNSDNTVEKMKNYQRVMDVITTTTASANVDAENFFESVKQGGPALVAAGGALELFAAMVGTLGDAGIKGGPAGVAVKNIALGLAGEGNMAASTLRSLGIATKTSEGALRGQVDVLKDLREALGRLPSGERLGILRRMFGVRNVAAGEILLKNIRRVEQLEAANMAAEGSAARMAAFIRDDVQGSLDAFKSAIESVKLSIFAMNEGGIKKTIDNMTDWIRANEMLIATRIGQFMQDMIDRGPELAETFVGIAGKPGCSWMPCWLS